MKFLPRIPLLVLAAIGLVSVALLLMASNGASRKEGQFHLVIKKVELKDVALQKFDGALDNLGDESRYSINYDPPPTGHPPHKGTMQHACPVSETHLNTNVTQQVSFKSTGDLKTFLDNAF